MDRSLERRIPAEHHDQESHDMDKVPVTILTGFLGAGKTTLLNRILSEEHGRRIAVIENEFGEVGVDNELVIGADEEVFEMNNGCICCTVRGDLIRILGNLLRRRDRFDRIVVETTGLADPGPVAQTFLVDDEIRERTVLDAIVAVVDAYHLPGQMDRAEEPARQIAFADTIVLNKVDLVGLQELDDLEARIRAINPLARLHRAVAGNVPLEEILDRRAFDLTEALRRDPAFLEPEHPFEWGGIYRMPKGGAVLSVDRGPNPTLRVSMRSCALADLEAAARVAEEVFADRSSLRKAGSRLKVDGPLQEIEFPSKGAGGKLLVVEAALKGGEFLSLFTQHHPDEFSLQLLGSGGEGLAPLLEKAWKGGHEHNDEVASVGIDMDGEIRLEELELWLGDFLQKFGPDIYRTKGVLAVKGEARRVVVQGVHMMLDHSLDRPWGKDPRRNRLVFIGKNLDRASIVAGFRSCLA